jgi:competence ComEA-like helix-hairpin-helix protein
VSENVPKLSGKRSSKRRANWDALFLKRADQAAFSFLWVAIVAGCVWYFVTARGFDPIDIDRVPHQPAGFLVEINSASKHEFDCLPGIGPKTATSITRWRNENGPFESVESMVAVPGVSEKLIEKVRSHLYVESTSEVSQK